MAKRSQLDTLLRIRRIEEDVAKGHLAAANLAVRQAEETLNARHDAYRQAAVVGGEAAPADFLRSRLAGAAMGASIVNAEQQCARTLAESQEAGAVVRVAKMRTQGLERLVDRAAQARVLEMLAADQRTAEESRAGNRTGGRR
ncbi:MAG: hypothetical protein IPI32_08645 [Austwickia sp.]|nr:hypothetical protein [Austwickia sp.]MBK8436451.1 hypothetical protein [Austwickia sp.]MBK9102127.1 hypothetical protein [Austwickia sp.]